MIRAGNPNSSHARLLILATAVLTLTACSSKNDELERFITDTRQQPGGRVEPLPEVKPYESFAYSASPMRSPFQPGGSAQGPTGSPQLRPDQRRNREFLEQFSLDTLRMVGTLKIDQSFIHGLPQDADDAGITTAIISMARSLGLDVIAEGVETSEQLAFLQRVQCPKLQGYLFSRPLPADEMAVVLRRGRIALPLKNVAE